MILLLSSCKKHGDLKLFTELPSDDTGIKFKNLVRESEEFNVLTYGYYYQGGGVAIGDVNNDSLPDIYFTGNMMASKLYINRGDWEFEDVTEQAGVAAAGLWNTGTTMADVNGDGFLDIYICRSAANDPDKRRNLLFINNGDLTFSEQANNFGLADPGYSTQASFFDYDRDGDLDMYLLNHSIQEYAGFSRITGNFKKRKDKNFGDKLYRNDGNVFKEVSESAGIISNVLGFGLAVTITDANNDGWLDIYISNDYSEEDYFYVNQKDGTFKESLKDHFGHVSLFSMGADGADINNDLNSDIITLDMLPENSYNQKMILDADGDGDQDLYIVSGGNEFQENAAELQDRLYINDGRGNFKHDADALPVMVTSGSSVTSADFNNDGMIDLFVGGRSVPGKYPLAPRSYLLKNTGKGKFADVTTEYCPALASPGMVTDAQFAKVNNDDLVDLVVVGEWMEINFFINDNGEKFRLKDDAIREETSGWWLSIEANDFDVDGDTDFVLGNFGLNNPYHADAQHPARVLYKDFDNNGSVDPIFHYYIGDTLTFAYSRDELIGQIPSMKKKFASYQSFAAADFSDYFSVEQLVGSDTLTASLLESVYLENDGNGNFDLRKLPVEAQFSPVYALASGDVNKDGHLDIITGGNLTQSRVSTGPCDANYGIVFLGDGKGSFSTLDPVASGLRITGDVRDISIIKIRGEDYMLVSRNGDTVKVYKIGKEKKVF